MSFTFQKNENVRFNHDEILLNKAEALKPHLIKTENTPAGLVTLTNDSSKLEGIGTKEEVRDLNTERFSKGDTIILDFGKHLVGHFSIDCKAKGSPMDAPLYLRIRFAQVAAELSHESKDYNGWLARSWIQEEFIHMDELPAKLELNRRYAFRYVEIKVLETSPKWQVAFSNPKAVSESAVEDLKDLKPLEDKQLEKIREVSLNTLKNCMMDVFEDGPKRDRRLWLGDLSLQAKANYSSFRQMDLVKRCLYLFGGMSAQDGRISANVFVKPSLIPNDTFLFEYSLFFAGVLNDYINQTSDMEALQDLYPAAKKQMDLSLGYVDEKGKLNLEESYPIFVEWSNDFDKSTAAQAIMIYAMKEFLQLANKAKEDTTKYKEVLNKMIKYSLESLYLPEKHLFICDNHQINAASQVWMVLADILDEEENKKVMETTVKELLPIHGIATLYMYQYITEALFKAGLKEEAVKLMKNYWGKMIDLGADTFWEAFDPEKPDYSPYGSPIISSYCHAWCCTPMYLIDQYLK